MATETGSSVQAPSADGLGNVVPSSPELAAPKIEAGRKVKTLQGDIDRNRHSGATGVVQGFARLSSYHAREVYVQFSDGRGAWFWASAVALEAA